MHGSEDRQGEPAVGELLQGHAVAVDGALKALGPLCGVVGVESGRVGKPGPNALRHAVRDNDGGEVGGDSGVGEEEFHKC